MNMHASTGMGNLNSDFAEGANNGGGPNVTATTGSGNVSIEKQ